MTTETSEEADNLRRKRSRIVVILLALCGGALFYWQSLSFPVEHRFTVSLTGVEIPHGTDLLRHESVQRYLIKVIDSEGAVVAEIIHRKPSAVTQPGSIRLPRGEYGLHVLLELRLPSGGTLQRNLMRQVSLDGGEFRLDL